MAAGQGPSHDDDALVESGGDGISRTDTPDYSEHPYVSPATPAAPERPAE